MHELALLRIVEIRIDERVNDIAVHHLDSSDPGVAVGDVGLVIHTEFLELVVFRGVFVTQCELRRSATTLELLDREARSKV